MVLAPIAEREQFRVFERKDTKKNRGLQVFPQINFIFSWNVKIWVGSAEGSAHGSAEGSGKGSAHGSADFCKSPVFIGISVYRRECWGYFTKTL